MATKSHIELVEQFNKSFGITIGKKPRALSESEYTMRYNLMLEELSEYLEACKNNDLVEIVDAIVDMQYVLNGFIVAHGLQKHFNELFNEVHSSNMSKLENGKVLKRQDGKILKGKNFFKPEIEKIIKK